MGRQIAERLAIVGYGIVVDHFRDPDGAQRTLELVRAAGSDGWAFDADVGSSEELDALFAKIAGSGMRLEVLVNNAAVQTFAPLMELSEQDWDRTIRTNLKGTFLCTQRAAKLMQSTGGAIVNIGSGANRIPFPSLGDYAASKGGIEMLTKVAAIELGKLRYESTASHREPLRTSELSGRVPTTVLPGAESRHWDASARKAM
ncbi:MAG: SDR family NAD(P)-dependent oxidoreductase [Pirellulaceae bacterium]